MYAFINPNNRLKRKTNSVNFLTFETFLSLYSTIRPLSIYAHTITGPIGWYFIVQGQHKMNMCANNNLILFFSVVLFLSFFVHKLDFISSEMSSGNHAVNVFSPQICANARLSTNVRTFWPRVCKVLCGGPNTAIWRHWVDATASLRAWTDQKLVEVSPAESALRHPRGWDDEVTGRAGFTVPARCGTYFTERESLEEGQEFSFPTLLQSIFCTDLMIPNTSAHWSHQRRKAGSSKLTNLENREQTLDFNRMNSS